MSLFNDPQVQEAHRLLAQMPVEWRAQAIEEAETRAHRHLIEAASLLLTASTLEGEFNPHRSYVVDLEDVQLSFAIDQEHEGCDFWDEDPDDYVDGSWPDDDDLDTEVRTADDENEDLKDLLRSKGFPVDMFEAMGFDIEVMVIEDQHADAQDDYERVFGGFFPPYALGPGI